MDTPLPDCLRQADVQPRPYQQRIVQQAIRWLTGRSGPDDSPAEAVGSVMIESPTGSGKTVMGLAVARHMQQVHGMRVGWAAMRRNLLTQVQRANLRHRFNVDLQVISMFDRQPPQVDLLVVDEAQHDAAMSMANLHSVIKPKKVLGLTATPFRTDRVKLCFEKVIKDASIHALIQDGYLSPYHHYTLPEYTPETVAHAFASEPRRWGPSLIFFHRHADCLDCQQMLRQQGIEAEVVTAQTDREAQIEAFEAGRIQVLINMLILTEGFDCPSLKTVFCRPSGRGCTIQMAGRVLRQHPDLPHKQIVQCGQTRHPFPRTATPAEQYLWHDGEWRSLAGNRELDRITGRMRRLLATCEPQLPTFLLQQRRRAPLTLTDEAAN